MLAAGSFIMAFWLREQQPIVADGGWSAAFAPYAGVLYFLVGVRLAAFAYHGVYRYHGPFAYTHDGIRIFKAVSVGSLLTVAWAFLFRGGFEFREFSYSRGVFVLDFALALVLFLVFHLALRSVQNAFRRRGINLIPTVVVGGTAEAEKAVEELRGRPSLGFKVLGTVGSGERPLAGAAYLGRPEELADIIREMEIQEVIIADDSLRSDQLFDVMMQVGRRRRVEFRYAPSMFDLLPQKTSVEQIGVLPMVRLFREPLSGGARLLKRTFDIVVSFAAIALSLPVWLMAAILIKLDSRGPVFFRQERVGMDGRIFLCNKFRTMSADADAAPHREAARRNISGEKEASEIFGKVAGDPRITRVGRWLRKWSFDELPQFLNVLRGDMSIVGPRPPIPYEVEEYRLRDRKRLDIKPGITGLWQVSGRNSIAFEDMVRLDLYYIENWSVWLDVKIILLTVPAVLRGHGEH